MAECRSGEGLAFSALRLRARVLDAHMHRHLFRPAADARAANGRRAKRVERHGDAHIGLVWTEGVDRIESDPSEVLDMGLRPAVTGDLLDLVIIFAKIAAHIARRNVERARTGNEDIREILAD